MGLGGQCGGPSGVQEAIGGHLGRQNGVQVALGGQFEGQVGVQVALGGQLEGPSGVQEALKLRLEPLKFVRFVGVGTAIEGMIYRGGNEGVRRRKALKTSPKLPKASQRLPKDSPNVSQSSPRVSQSLPKGSPRVSQSLPKPPKPPQSLPKAVPKPDWPRLASRGASSSTNGISRAHAQTKIELACRRELQKILKCLTDSKSPTLGRRFDDFFNFLPYVTKGGIDFFEKKTLSSPA